MGIPVPAKVLELEPLALAWATSLLRRMAVSDVETITNNPYPITTADLLATVQKKQGPSPSVVALAVATLGLAWNHVGKGQCDPARPIVAAVVPSLPGVKVSEAHAVAYILGKIPTVLALPCMVIKKGKKAVKVNASIHVQGSSRAMGLATRGLTGEKPTPSSLLSLLSPDSIKHNWGYAHKVDTCQNEWYQSAKKPMDEAAATSVLRDWESRLTEAWVDAGDTSVPCIEAVVRLLFPKVCP